MTKTEMKAAAKIQAANLAEIATKRAAVEADTDNYVAQFIRAADRNRANANGCAHTLGIGKRISGIFSKTAPATPYWKDKRATA